jgi:hypothetical protein
MDESKVEDLTAIVGPGGDTSEEVDPKPLLEGVGDYNFVEVLNPLSVTFKDQVALTTNINSPMPVGKNHENAPGLTNSENDIRQIYGFDLRAQAQASGKTHVITRISLASGETRRFLGSEAHVIVRHLASALLQREGKTHLLANAHERRRAEERIVQHVGSLMDAMGRSPLSVREQLQTTLDSIEDAPNPQTAQGGSGNEAEFPGLSDQVGAATAPGDQGQPAPDAPRKRGAGRPAAQTNA